MTQRQLTERLQLYAPTGYAFWTGFDVSDYQSKLTKENTMLVITPNPYPSLWRVGSSSGFRVDGVRVLLARNVPLKKTGSDREPYESTLVEQSMRDLFDVMLAEITADDYIHIRSADTVEFDASLRARSANSQVFAFTRLNLHVWPKSDNTLTATLNFTL